MSIAYAIYPGQTAAPASPAAIWMAAAERVVAVIVLLQFSNFLPMVLVDGLPNRPPQEASTIARLTWYPIYLMVLAASLVKWREMLQGLVKVWPLIAIFVLAAVSISNSIDPSLTQRRVVALFFTLHAGFYLAARAPLVDTLKLFGWVWLFMIILNFFFIILIPVRGIDSTTHVGAWTGFLGTKNMLGGEMARIHIFYFALLFFDQKNRAAWIAGLVLSAILVWGADSKTALLAMAAPYGVYAAYVIGQRSLFLGVFTAWAAVSMIGLGYFVTANFSEELVGLIGKDLTFSGRTELWQLCMDKINQAQWTGYGYAAFWFTENGPGSVIEDILQWRIPSAHNSWIEAGLGMGYPGVFMLGLATAMAFYKAFTLMFGRHGPILLMMLVQFFLFSLSESMLLEQNFNSSLMFAYVLSICLLARPTPREDTGANAAWMRPIHRPRKIA